MPNLNDQPVQGGPTMPVFVMNGLPGDVSSINPLSGFPTNASWTSGTKAAAGNNTVLSAPGVGKRITVHYMWVQNESANVTTVQLVDIVARWRLLMEQYRIGLMFSWQLNGNTALTMNLSGANSIGYSLLYSIDNI